MQLITDELVLPEESESQTLPWDENYSTTFP